MTGVLAIHGVFNFRDLASASPLLRPGMVYRSDGLHRTDAAGGDALAALGIRRVMDLRSLQEQEYEGMFAHPDIDTVSAPLVADSVEIGRQLSQGGDDPLHSHYIALLDDAPTQIAQAMAAVADSILDSAPIVFHCTAGKDRTGLLAALLLALAGVDDEAILDDFHASAAGVEAMSMWYQQERGETHADKAAQMGIDPSIAHHMMLAERSTMAATLAVLRARHTDVDTFATTIGVTADHLIAIGRLGANRDDQPATWV